MAEDLILYLYVDSVLRTGVSDNLTLAKSNSELVRSLEVLLEHSLACPKHQSTPLPSVSCSSSSTLFEGVSSLTRPSKADEECEAVASWSYIPPPASPNANDTPAYVTIPAQDSIRQEPSVAFPETREALDVTAKFFYLPPSDYSPTPSTSKDGSLAHGSTAASVYDSLDPVWMNEALEQLRIATGITEIDTFIISFPGLTFDDAVNGEDCCDDANARTNGSNSIAKDEDAIRRNVLKVWKEASKNKHLLTLGVSEFSLDRLRWLLGQAKEEESDAGRTKEAVVDGEIAKSSTASGRANTTGITSTRFRKPRVCQVNTRNRCDVPPELVEFAKEEDVELLVHADCSDFLPPRTFTRLLARYGARLPPPLTHRGTLDFSTLSSKSQHRRSASSSSLKSRADLNKATVSTSLHGLVNGFKTSSASSEEEEEEKEAREVLQALSARWVLKYTVLIRDRALVADKGYIVKASRNGH